MDAGSNISAFALSLAKLSKLLVKAGEDLHPNELSVLEKEITHGWRVDAMSDYLTMVLEHEKEIKDSTMQE